MPDVHPRQAPEGSGHPEKDFLGEEKILLPVAKGTLGSSSLYQLAHTLRASHGILLSLLSHSNTEGSSHLTLSLPVLA